MPNECKLTIVIPLYNSREYFPKCLDSIYGQQLDENLFEVIVVDDGSNDGVEIFADDAAKAHSNMRVIHQANSGAPSIPRNRGLAMATGKFVFFCDSDDMFLPGSLEKMIRHAEQDEPDVGLFNLDSDGRGVKYGGLFEKEMKHCTVLNSKITNFLGPYKLFRTSFLHNHNLTFSNTYYEDLSFVMEAFLLSANTCIYNDGPYYFLRLRDDQSSMTQSGTTKRGANSLEKRILGLEHLASTVSAYYSSSICPQIYIRLFENATMLLKSCFRGEDPEESIHRIKSILAPHFSSELKALLDVRSNMTISALLNPSISFSELADLVFSWPNGPSCSFSSNEEYLAFKQYDRHGKLVDEGAIPMVPEWNDSPQSRFCIIDNDISSMYIGDGKARYCGRSVVYADAFERIDSVQLTCKSKSRSDNSFDIQIKDFQRTIVSESLGMNRYSFAWRAEFDLRVIRPSDVDACNYVLSLTLCTDKGSYSFRVGQTAEERIKQDYIRDYSFDGDDLYFGYLTKFGNANIGVKKGVDGIAVSVIEADVDEQNHLAFRILLMAPKDFEKALFETGYRNRRTGCFLTASQFALSASGSLEAAFALDDSLCRRLLSESLDDDIWDFVVKAEHSGEDDDRFEGIGSQRPAGTMALLRQHACVCDGHAFICYENKEKNLSLIVQRESKVLDDARKIKLTAISCGDNQLMLNACLDEKSVAMRPQVKLVYCTGTDTFPMQGESYDSLDKRFRHEIRAVFNMDDLLRRYDKREDFPIDDHWNLEVVASLDGKSKQYHIGSRRPKGSFARYQKVACFRNGIAALPFETHEKNLFIRVASASYLIQEETSMRVSSAAYEAEGIRISGSLKTPMLLCADSFDCLLGDEDAALSLRVEMNVNGGSSPHADWTVLIPFSASIFQMEPESKKSYRFAFNLAVGGEDYRIPSRSEIGEAAIRQVNASLSSAGFPLVLAERKNCISLDALQRNRIASIVSRLLGSRKAN